MESSTQQNGLASMGETPDSRPKLVCSLTYHLQPPTTITSHTRLSPVGNCQSPGLLPISSLVSFFHSLTPEAHSQPSMPAGSTSADSTNHGSKIFKKFPESSKKQNLNLLHDGNYLHSIYIVFTIIYIAFALC